MKQILKLTFVGIIALFFFASCIKDIEFKGNVVEPLIVLNSIVSPDSILKVHVSKSRFFLDADEISVIPDADVSVYINNRSEGKMTHIGEGYYELNHTPVAGDVVRFDVDASDMPSVWSETQLLPQVEIIAIDTVGTVLNSENIYDGYGIGATPIGVYYQVEYRFNVKFKDPVGVKNYYQLSVLKKINYDTFYYFYSDFNFDDIVAKDQTQIELSDFYNQYNIFTDDLIDGKEYPLTFSVVGSKYNYLPGKQPASFRPDEIHINLRAISHDYYYYLKTKEMSENNTDNPFAEPVQIHNNVHNGIGILGTFTNNSSIIELTY
jgi:hypothetical protein